MVRVKKVRLSVHKEECPVCERTFDRGEPEGDIRAHVEHCIATTRALNMQHNENYNQKQQYQEVKVKLPPISALEEHLLDVDNVEGNYGPPQYTTSSLLTTITTTPKRTKTTLLKMNNSAKDKKYPQNFLLSVIANQQQQLGALPRCRVCLESAYGTPLVSTVCWHVMCEGCWISSLKYKRVCPACSSITSPEDLRRVFL